MIDTEKEFWKAAGEELKKKLDFIFTQNVMRDIRGVDPYEIDENLPFYRLGESIENRELRCDSSKCNKT